MLIGDSTTDVTAVRAAGTAVIAHANKAHKRTDFAAYGPDSIIDDLHEIAHLPSTHPS